MTLTLDDVRNTKFHMARRGGYEVTEVDIFVDKVEASVAEFAEQNDALKKQLETLRTSQSAAPAAAPAAAPSAESTRELESARSEATTAKSEVEKLKRELETARGEAEKARAELETARSEAETARGEAKKARADLQTAQAAKPAGASARPSVENTARPATGTVTGGGERLVVTTSAEASAAVARMVQISTEHADRLLGEADADAKRKVQAAEQKAHQLTTDAQTRADRVESEARVNAEKFTNDAHARANEMQRQMEGRRVSMLAALEQERDRLKSAVEQLRTFERQYRTNITGHLRSQIENLEKGRLEPTEKPAGVDGAKPATPRLDALSDNR